MIKIWPGLEINGANAYVRLYRGDLELCLGARTYTIMWGFVTGENGVYIHDENDTAKCRQWYWEDIYEMLTPWRRNDGPNTPTRPTGGR